MKLRSAKQCGICLEDCNNAVRGNGCVGHFFCEPCLRKWTAAKNTCPLCRAKLTAVVTAAHGYCRATVQPPAPPASTVPHFRVSTLAVRFFRHGPDAPCILLTVHVSWATHLSDVANVLGAVELPVARELLLYPFDLVMQVRAQAQAQVQAEEGRREG